MLYLKYILLKHDSDLIFFFFSFFYLERTLYFMRFTKYSQIKFLVALAFFFFNWIPIQDVLEAIYICHLLSSNFPFANSSAYW